MLNRLTHHCFQHGQQYRSLPPSGRERTYSDAPYQQSNGYQGGYSRGRGGGGYRPRNNDFDSRSVRSNRKNTYRPSKQKFPADTRSEVAHNEDTQSIASTTFSTDTAVYNNGFASELNSRHASFQSLLGADLQNFDWVAALEDDTPLSCLENLPETDSNGNQGLLFTFLFLFVCFFRRRFVIRANTNRHSEKSLCDCRSRCERGTTNSCFRN